MKILLTGVTGFIGSHLIKKLTDHEVVCLVAPSDLGMRDIPDRETKFADLTNHSLVQSVVKGVSPEAIIHLAAITPVRYSFERPEIYQEVNYLATINLAHAALKIPNFKKFIFASTMETYGWQTQRIPFVESLVLNPASPYAVSKVAAENYIKMMGKAFNFPHFIAKPCNTYGRKDRTGFFIEYLITRMLKNETPYMGTPDAVRDWMHVDDHTDAYVKLVEYEDESIQQRKQNLDNDPTYYVFNFGNGLSLTNKEVAFKIKQLVGYTGDLVFQFPKDYPNRPVVDEYLSLNSSKAEHVLGWKPKVSLKEGLRKTIELWKKKLNIG